MAYLSKSLSWKRIVLVFFLPVVLTGLAPRYDNFKSPARFSWSRLSPFKLKNRTIGLSTVINARGKPYFTLEGHKFMIVGGSMHYFRVPREYWKDRLLKLQACGFNTVTTYIPWNLHEQEKGKFDFSDILDLETYVSLAASVGLWVILRPGPYICAEIDLGGLPSWLLRYPESKLRTTNKSFLEAVDRYFDHLIPRILPLQYSHGGPVIAVQIENEYGSFYKDKNYMNYLKKALLKRGIVELLLTSDNGNDIHFGSVQGALATINTQAFVEDYFIKLHRMQTDKPIMIMEYWTGWYDTWGSMHHAKTAKDVQHTVSRFIKCGFSFNMYMFHGGTNFGFINGARQESQHLAVVTSYDYDAVLTEAGDYTEKYFMLRKLFASSSAGSLPPLPSLTPKTVYRSVIPSFYLPLFDTLPYLNKPVTLYTPVTMENLPINNGSGQPFGLVLYETSICSGGRLLASVHDSAQVFLNNISIGILDEHSKILNIPKIRGCQLLRILVENQGRINFSWNIQNEQKGLNEFISINKVLLRNFTIYSLDMKMSFFNRLRLATPRLAPEYYIGPAFYWGTLNVGFSPKDTFLDLPNWTYGFVFINGRNLGRYHSIGPQRTLYLPGPWLHPEDNEIVVFEMINKGFCIQTTNKPQL
ncbi:beta-galactosidase-1-like protein 3 [Meriones unguiculatus]|uniref:beta-galactosidase-1-like protein 3 n=1 Tax=Meriones unguiculatus TaxID=10047 RepID=UPI000B4F2AD3|nr:beta-galactosidase-1-like protein 3 [Meriones unguiculatus]